MSRLRRLVRRFRRAADGNVMVETALVTPFVLLALFGAVDIVRYLQVQDAVIRAASTTADAIARQNGITASQVSAFLDHAAATIDPSATGGLSRITVASVHKKGDAQPKVAWRRGEDAGDEPYAGGCEKIGLEGALAALPTGFGVDNDETIVVAEACYTFAPAFVLTRALFDLEFVPLQIYGRAIAAARFGSLNILEP